MTLTSKKSFHFFLVLLVSLFCLSNIGFAEPKEEIEFTKQVTVKNASIEVPADYQVGQLDQMSTDSHLFISHSFNPPQNDKTSVPIILLYSAPLDPSDIKNFRFKYDFRSGTSAEAFAVPFQKDFDSAYNINSQWDYPDTKKINGNHVLILKGKILSPQGEVTFYHDHYVWATSKSEVYRVSFLYQEKNSKNQKMIRKIVESFQLPTES